MSKHLFQSRVLRVAGAAALALVLSGCGPQFDPPSKLQSLRILAVKKDDPYLRPTAAAPIDPSVDYEPDNTAHMTLAMQDARLEQDKLNHLQKLWFGGCNNPFSDNYFGCLVSVWLSFRAFSELGTGVLNDGETWSIADIPQTLESAQRVNDFLNEIFPGYSQSSGSKVTGPNGETIDTNTLLKQAEALKIGAGDVFDYSVPRWVIEQHTPPADPDIPRYGLSQVFLAVCDGDIGLSPDWQQNVDALAVMTDATRGFPLTCYRPNTTKERGPDNFMVSYSNLYVYDEFKNKNPVISGFNIDGEPVNSEAVCIGGVCADESGCADSMPKVKRCQRGGAADCKEFAITPILVKKDNQEVDDLASRVGGGTTQLYEQMWIRYYADTGDIKNDAKRLQDATEGWFAEHDTKWTAPNAGKAGDVAHIWSVVYDNRGGVDWARVSVCLED